MTTPEELEAIRARHEAAEKDGGHEWCGVHGPGAHADRATLLRLLSEERAAVNALPELLERERRVEWQPIETAPRDGQDILVYCQDSSEMFVGFSNPDEIAADPDIFFYALRTDGRRIGCRPHLWRSLPTPPATNKDTQDE